MDTSRHDHSRRPAPEARGDDRAGFALEATLMIMILLGGLVLVLMETATTAFRTGFLDYTNSRAFYAAEAGAEAAMGQIAIMIEDGELADGEVSEIVPPEMEGFSFDSFSVNKIGAVDIETITDGPFSGLYSLTQYVEVYSEARDPTGSSNAVLVSAKAQAIPIFQFGVFFEKDLEATNGPPLEFAGWIHSNGNIYLSSDNAWYRDQITTPNELYWDRKDFHEKDPGVYVNDALGNEVQLDFDSRSHPVHADFRAESEAKFDSRVKTDAHGVDSLTVPLPPGMDPIEVLLPREDTDTEMEKRAKMAWKADMHLEVNFANLSTAADECGTTVPYQGPDDVSAGDITITATNGICPGLDVTFTVSHAKVPCDEFDDRATLVEVSWGGDKFYENDPMDGCQFTVSIPNGVARDFVVKVFLDKDNYAQLDEDLNLDVKWTEESISGNCGDGMGGGGNKYGSGGFSTPWPTLIVTRNGQEVPGIPEICKIFDFGWAAFYDGRELDYRDVLNVDIDALTNWVAGGGNRTSEVIYVEFVVPSTVPGSITSELKDYSIDPAVRMVNGTVLPNPLTVATHFPMYVQGDYNAIDWKPAAVMGDAITLLSNTWHDGDHQSGWSFDEDGDIQGYKTDATDSQYWMAVLAGHSATPCDHEEASCAGGYQDFYGGGIENYLRFLERWSGETATYRGSLVSLHISETVDGTWNGNYYSPPSRDWAFDTRFEDPSNLPPGTPTVGNVIHTAFRPVY